MTNKQEHGVDTLKFEHNTLKRGDKKVSLLDLVATAKSLILRSTVIFGNLPIQQ